MNNFTQGYVDEERKTFTFAKHIGLLLKIEELINPDNIDDTVNIAILALYMNQICGSAVIVPESFVDLIANEDIENVNPETVMEALQSKDDVKFDGLVSDIADAVAEVS